MSGRIEPEFAPTDRLPGLPEPDSDATDRTRLGTAPPTNAAKIGPYRLVSKLGEGGMGVVYKAHDTALDRPVAVKVLRDDLAADPEHRVRFLREAKAAASVKHDNVVTIYQVGDANGVPYMAMELLQGISLDRYLAQDKPISYSQASRIGREAARGLAAAHAKGIIHRDIKPANLWLEAPTGRVKVLDFGLAVPATDHERLTASGVVLGTPAYMAPEQARGEAVDERSDLFSLGSVLFRLVAGRLPFPGVSTMAVLTSLAVDRPPPVRSLAPQTPEPLASLIDDLLAKDPSRRPQTAKGVAKRLARQSRSDRGDANSALFVAGDGTGSPLPRWRIGLIALGCLIVAMLTLLMYLTRGGPTMPGKSANPATKAVVPEVKVVSAGPPAVKAAPRADVPPPPPFDRKLWQRNDGLGQFERVDGKTWKEQSLERPMDWVPLVEVASTDDYLDLFDAKRGLRLRFYPDRADALSADGERWVPFYQGHWFDPAFRGPPEGKAGKGPEGKMKGKGKGPPPLRD